MTFNPRPNIYVCRCELCGADNDAHGLKLDDDGDLIFPICPTCGGRAEIITDDLYAVENLLQSLHL